MRNILHLSVMSFAFVLLLGISSCGPSRKTLVMEEGWELIGETKANFVKDKDEVVVDTTKHYTQLRFKVEEREIKIDELKVYFTNGDKLEPNLAEPIKPASYSRDIELSSEGKSIQKITFKYRTTGSMLKGRAAILVLGKRYQGW